MLALPHLTGTEFILALCRLGFRTNTRSGGLATMYRDARAVVVPETATLSPALVASILRSAGVEPLDLLGAIDAGDGAGKAEPTSVAP
jgi:predicted RNA binding protein YcfA (HicA-like mRNA interferase family)